MKEELLPLLRNKYDDLCSLPGRLICNEGKENKNWIQIIPSLVTGILWARDNFIIITRGIINLTLQFEENSSGKFLFSLRLDWDVSKYIFYCCSYNIANWMTSEISNMTKQWATNYGIPNPCRVQQFHWMATPLKSSPFTLNGSFQLY